MVESEDFGILCSGMSVSKSGKNGSSDGTSGWMGIDIGGQRKCSRNVVGGIASTAEIWPPKEAMMGDHGSNVHFELCGEHKSETAWPDRTDLAMQGHFQMLHPCPCIAIISI